MIPLEKLIIYQDAMDLGEEVWDLVAEWNSFEKQTVGRQIVRSADSISANIAEGHGRYQYGDRRQFSYYARGSLHETRTWMQKSANRLLIPQTKFELLDERTAKLGRMLTGYIKTIGP